MKNKIQWPQNWKKKTKRLKIELRKFWSGFQIKFFWSHHVSGNLLFELPKCSWNKQEFTLITTNTVDSELIGWTQTIWKYDKRTKSNNIIWLNVSFERNKGYHNITITNEQLLPQIDSVTDLALKIRTSMARASRRRPCGSKRDAEQLVFFAAYVICTKNYSFSRVVFLFFSDQNCHFFFIQK